MIHTWLRDHPWVDYLLGLLGLVTLLVPQGLVDDKSDALAGATAGVISILGAVVTFACSAIYQSEAPPIQKIRKTFGQRLRLAWIHSISVIACSALVTLAAIPIGYWSTRLAFGVTLAMLGLAAAATARSLDMLNLTLKSSPSS
ncbi:hypothetical protein [Propionibacterium freudenreichii]|uniref:hypothetical protein n=1 Tax=Propionibacterium freudenreichii TaxID=1744 RepID=UPI003854F58A